MSTSRMDMRIEDEEDELTPTSMYMLHMYREFLIKTQHLHGTTAYLIWKGIKRGKWSVEMEDDQLCLSLSSSSLSEVSFEGSSLECGVCIDLDNDSGNIHIYLSGDKKELDDIHNGLQLLSKYRF